jgi:capsular polysaccharide biosynthesis protein
MNDSWSVWHEAKQVVSTYWPVIFSLMLVGGLAGAGMAFGNPVTYTARAELITGNYSLPAEVASQPAIAKAGALGLELPAETQARIIASPTIVDVAAQALRLDEPGSAALRSSVKATATTDNSFSVSAIGATPEAAAANVNAVATAYLQYRADIGRADMNLLAERAHAAAKDSLASAAALADPLANAQASNPGYAASILAKREELERAASSAESTAAALDAAAQNFNGGGAVVRPGTSAEVEGSPSMLMLILLGLAVGLLGGVAFAVVRRQISDRIVDRRDIMRATGLTEIFELGGQRDGGGAGQLLLRSVEQSSIRLGISAEQIVVRPLTPSDLGAAGLLGLAAGGQASLGSVAVVALRKEAGAEIAHELGMSRGSTPLSALSGHELASVNSEIGCEASAVFGTTPTPTGTYALLLLASGPHFEAGRNQNSLPAGFSGPTVLVVRRRKDRVQDLEQAMDELNAANLPVVAILIADQAKGRGRKNGRGRAEGSKTRKASSERTGTSRALRSDMPNPEVERKSPTTAGNKS